MGPPAIPLSVGSAVALLGFAVVFAFFAACFGAAAHQAIAADYLPIAGGKFGLVTVMLGATIALAWIFGILLLLAGWGMADEYHEDNGYPVITVFCGTILFGYAFGGLTDLDRNVAEWQVAAAVLPMVLGLASWVSICYAVFAENERIPEAD